MQLPPASRILVALAVCAGIGGRAIAQDAEDDTARREREGHARMLALLKELHEEGDVLNAFLGSSELRRFEQLVAEADETGDAMGVKQRGQRHYYLGLELLRMGRPKDAIESMRRARELVDPLSLEDRPRYYERLVYDLGVAYMRYGEQQNCVAMHTSRSCILPIVGDGVHVDQFGSRAAMKLFREARTLTEPGTALDVSARWLLNIMAMTVGEYPGGLEGDEAIDFDVFSRSEASTNFPPFTDVAPKLGLNVVDHSGGAIVDDFDGDGLLDVMSSSWHSAGQIHFFRNVGDGTFEERTDAANLTGIVGGLNLVQADYDDDGDVDVLVLRGAWIQGPAGRHPNSLLRNEGDGTFLDVTFVSGIGVEHYPTQTGAWGDYDLDGDLDLFLGSEADDLRRYPSQLFRNEGDGTFVDVAKEAGVQNLRFAKGVVFGDYDGDRYPDVYVSNLDGENRLYRNQHDGTFVDVAPELGATLPLRSFPTWFWDFDNDGNLDLFVSSYDKGENTASYRLATVAAAFAEVADESPELATSAPALYRGDGKGGLRDVARDVGLTRPTLPMSGNFGDLDNDGWLDFYLGTGYPYYDGLIPNAMFKSIGGERFVDVTTAGGFGHLQKGHGIAFADLDLDGDQDVFEQMGGAFPGDAFGNVLYENPGTKNGWLKVRLIGTESNRSAIGARIHARFVDGDATRSVYRFVSSGGSFGANPLMQHLGVGAAQEIERLEVYWPKTDETQVFEHLPVGCRVEITEGSEEPRIVHETPFTLGG